MESNKMTTTAATTGGGAALPCGVIRFLQRFSGFAHDSPAHGSLSCSPQFRGVRLAKEGDSDA
jgi:hypothetical protein